MAGASLILSVVYSPPEKKLDISANASIIDSMFKKIKENFITFWNKSFIDSFGQRYIDYEYENYEDKYIRELNNKKNREENKDGNLE